MHNESMDDYRKRKQDEADERKSLCIGVAAALTKLGKAGAWRMVEADSNASRIAEGESPDFLQYFIQDTAGRWVALGASQGRIIVNGFYPKMPDGDIYSYPGLVNAADATISVSDKKSHEQIAQDILRRFLPTYLTTWNALKAYVEQVQAASIATNNTVEALVQAGVAQRLHNDSKYLSSKLNRCRHIRVDSVDSIHVEFYSLTLEQTLAIAKVLGTK